MTELMVSVLGVADGEVARCLGARPGDGGGLHCGRLPPPPWRVRAAVPLPVFRARARRGARPLRSGDAGAVGVVDGDGAVVEAFDPVALVA